MESLEKLRVLLINPHGFDTSSVIPMSLAYLKANIENSDNFEVKILSLESPKQENVCLLVLVLVVVVVLVLVVVVVLALPHFNSTSC